MPDTKITALTAIGANPIIPATFPIPMVDLTDTSMAASGTTKKVTVNQILGAGGTATLASATITGDLTVATDRLKVVTGSTAVQTGATTQLQVGTTSWPSTVIGKSGSRSLFGNTGEVVLWTEAAPAIGNYSTLFVTAKTGAGATTMGGLQIRAGIENASNSDGFVSLWTSNSAAGGFVERYKIDSTGVATWSNVGGVAGTAMTLNANGLGIGASPTNKFTIGVSIYNPAASQTSSLYTEATRGLIVLSDGFTVATRTGSNMLILDTSGNVGIGVTPSFKLDVQGSGIRLNSGSATGFALLRLGGTASDSFFGFAGNANDIVTGSSAGDTVIGSNKAGANLRFISGNGSLNATLDASGNLLVGVTAAPSGTIGGSGFIADSNSRKQLHLATTASTSQVLAVFINPNGTVGTIETNGSSTAYNISSDYRLKEEVKPLTGALNRITALKPSTYKWKVDGSVGEGFIAHELAEVVPFAVSGQKDAVNEDGSIKTQGVDLSKIVPILVAAIQELTARVQTLETR